jgi:hypothetical protein
MPYGVECRLRSLGCAGIQPLSAPGVGTASRAVGGEITTCTHVAANLNTVQYGAFHYTGIETHIFMSMNEKCIKRCI